MNKKWLREFKIVIRLLGCRTQELNLEQTCGFLLYLVCDVSCIIFKRDYFFSLFFFKYSNRVERHTFIPLKTKRTIILKCSWIQG